MLNMYKEGTYLIIHPIVTSVQHIRIQVFQFLYVADLFKNVNNGTELKKCFKSENLKSCTDV